MVRDLRDLRSNASTDADASVDVKEEEREEEALVGVGGRTGKRRGSWGFRVLWSASLQQTVERSWEGNKFIEASIALLGQCERPSAILSWIAIILEVGKLGGLP
jgi:hypothetical protein